jgi:hypothetical protein
MTCLTAATGVDVYVQLRPDASTYILYDQLYAEVKGFM